MANHSLSILEDRKVDAAMKTNYNKFRFTYFLIRSKISTALQVPSMRLLIQVMASYETNVHDGKLCALARKLTPVAGCRIASNISINGADGLILVSARKDSSWSSVVTTRVFASIFIARDVASAACAIFAARSKTLLPDLWMKKIF